MIRRLFAGFSLFSAVALLAQPVKGFDRDGGAIRRMATRFAETWNAHDMEAMSALFTDDADFVNVAGMHWKGREQIRKEHARLHELQMKESTVTVRAVDVRFLKPDVALAHIEWKIEGDRDPDGTSRQPREGILSWVVTKRAGEWRIAAAQNTNLRTQGTNP